MHHCFHIKKTHKRNASLFRGLIYCCYDLKEQQYLIKKSTQSKEKYKKNVSCPPKMCRSIDDLEVKNVGLCGETSSTKGSFRPFVFYFSCLQWVPITCYSSISLYCIIQNYKVTTLKPNNRNQSLIMVGSVCFIQLKTTRSGSLTHHSMIF